MEDYNMNTQTTKAALFALFTLSLALLCFHSNKITVQANNLSENYKPTITDTIIDKSSQTIELHWSVNSSDYDYFIIYRSTSKNGSYEYYDETYSLSYTDYDAQPGISYYYKIVTVYENDDWEEIFSDPAYSNGMCIPLSTPVIKSIKAVNSHGLKLTWNSFPDTDGYAIYRSDKADGTYTWIKNIKNDNDWYWNFENEMTYTDKNLIVGKTYYYKIRPYVTYQGTNYYNNYSTYKFGQATINSAVISKAVSKKKSTNTITWKKISEANGYIVYYSKKYNGKYKKLKTITTNKKVSYTHKKLKNGTAYYYKVYAYKNNAGKQLLSCEPAIYEKYCDYFTYANESFESRQKRVFGNSKKKWYSSASKAKKNMKTIKIKVWDINSKGKKYTRKFYLTVQKNLAPSVKQMFKEIYKSKEKFPIHDIGCYSWRGDNSTSEHCIGAAIDINSNENYMIEDGKILAGSFWKPKKNKYSIPLKCSLVKILEKYGFQRGFWGNRKDYMHFSYFGT